MTEKRKTKMETFDDIDLKVNHELKNPEDILNYYKEANKYYYFWVVTKSTRLCLVGEVKIQTSPSKDKLFITTYWEEVGYFSDIAINEILALETKSVDSEKASMKLHLDIVKYSHQ